MKVKFSFSKLIIGIAMLFIPKIVFSQQPTPAPDSVEMVFILGGTFQMGTDDDGLSNEKPVHTVTVNNFYLGKFEVTVGQFSQFISETGYKTDAEKHGGTLIPYTNKWEKQSGVTWRCDADLKTRPQSEYNHPVIHVSWNDATEYCKWLSRKTRHCYRLPTEAEWEYAAGNGSKHTKWSWGNGFPNGKNGGNVADESLKRKYSDYEILSGYDDGYALTAPIGSYNPNELGLYDMTGNIMEWCSDWFGEIYYESSPSDNPKGPLTGKFHVFRGGCWWWTLINCRTTTRLRLLPDFRTNTLGFRLSMSN